MENYEVFDCIKKELQSDQVMKIEKIDPEECCLVKFFFQTTKPGKYKVEATLKYDESKKPVILKTETIVEPKIAAALNIGMITIAYTLTRLNLNFTLK